MNDHDRDILNKINRLLNEGVPTDSEFLNDFASAKPVPTGNVKQRLEDRLLEQLATRQKEKVASNGHVHKTTTTDFTNVKAHILQAPTKWQRRAQVIRQSRLPLSIAATLVLILFAGSLIYYFANQDGNSNDANVISLATNAPSIHTVYVEAAVNPLSIYSGPGYDYSHISQFASPDSEGNTTTDTPFKVLAKQDNWLKIEYESENSNLGKESGWVNIADVLIRGDLSDVPKLPTDLLVTPTLSPEFSNNPTPPPTPTSPDELQAVVISVMEIELGTTIDESMVDISYFRTTRVPEFAYADVSEVIGMVALETLPANSAIQSLDLATRNQVSSSNFLSNGNVAVIFAIPEDLQKESADMAEEYVFSIAAEVDYAPFCQNIVGLPDRIDHLCSVMAESNTLYGDETFQIHVAIAEPTITGLIFDYEHLEVSTATHKVILHLMEADAVFNIGLMPSDYESEVAESNSQFAIHFGGDSTYTYAISDGENVNGLQSEDKLRVTAAFSPEAFCTNSEAANIAELCDRFMELGFEQSNTPMIVEASNSQGSLISFMGISPTRHYGVPVIQFYVDSIYHPMLDFARQDDNSLLRLERAKITPYPLSILTVKPELPFSDIIEVELPISAKLIPHLNIGDVIKPNFHILRTTACAATELRSVLEDFYQNFLENVCNLESPANPDFDFGNLQNSVIASINETENGTTITIPVSSVFEPIFTWALGRDYLPDIEIVGRANREFLDIEDENTINIDLWDDLETADHTITFDAALTGNIQVGDVLWFDYEFDTERHCADSISLMDEDLRSFVEAICDGIAAEAIPQDTNPFTLELYFLPVLDMFTVSEQTTISTSLPVVLLEQLNYLETLAVPIKNIWIIGRAGYDQPPSYPPARRSHFDAQNDEAGIALPIDEDLFNRISLGDTLTLSYPVSFDEVCTGADMSLDEQYTCLNIRRNAKSTTPTIDFALESIIGLHMRDGVPTAVFSTEFGSALGWTWLIQQGIEPTYTFTDRAGEYVTLTVDPELELTLNLEDEVSLEFPTANTEICGLADADLAEVRAYLDTRCIEGQDNATDLVSNGFSATIVDLREVDPQPNITVQLTEDDASIVRWLIDNNFDPTLTVTQSAKPSSADDSVVADESNPDNADTFVETLGIPVSYEFALDVRVGDTVTVELLVDRDQHCATVDDIAIEENRQFIADICAGITSNSESIRQNQGTVYIRDVQVHELVTEEGITTVEVTGLDVPTRNKYLTLSLPVSAIWVTARDGESGELSLPLATDINPNARESEFALILPIPQNIYDEAEVGDLLSISAIDPAPEICSQYEMSLFDQYMCSEILPSVRQPHGQRISGSFMSILALDMVDGQPTATISGNHRLEQISWAVSHDPNTSYSFSDENYNNYLTMTVGEENYPQFQVGDLVSINFDLSYNDFCLSDDILLNAAIMALCDDLDPNRETPVTKPYFADVLHLREVDPAPNITFVTQPTGILVIRYLMDQGFMPTVEIVRTSDEPDPRTAVQTSLDGRRQIAIDVSFPPNLNNDVQVGDQVTLEYRFDMNTHCVNLDTIPDLAMREFIEQVCFNLQNNPLSDFPPTSVVRLEVINVTQSDTETTITVASIALVMDHLAYYIAHDVPLSRIWVINRADDPSMPTFTRPDDDPTSIFAVISVPIPQDLYESVVVGDSLTVTQYGNSNDICNASNLTGLDQKKCSEFSPYIRSTNTDFRLVNTEVLALHLVDNIPVAILSAVQSSAERYIWLLGHGIQASVNESDLASISSELQIDEALYEQLSLGDRLELTFTATYDRLCPTDTEPDVSELFADYCLTTTELDGAAQVTHQYPIIVDGFGTESETFIIMMESETSNSIFISWFLSQGIQPDISILYQPSAIEWTREDALNNISVEIASTPSPSETNNVVDENTPEPLFPPSTTVHPDAALDEYAVQVSVSQDFYDQVRIGDGLTVNQQYRYDENCPEGEVLSTDGARICAFILQQLNNNPDQTTLFGFFQTIIAKDIVDGEPTLTLSMIQPWAEVFAWLLERNSADALVFTDELPTFITFRMRDTELRSALTLNEEVILEFNTTNINFCGRADEALQVLVEQHCSEDAEPTDQITITFNATVSDLREVDTQPNITVYVEDAVMSGALQLLIDQFFFPDVYLSNIGSVDTTSISTDELFPLPASNTIHPNAPADEFAFQLPVSQELYDEIRISDRLMVFQFTVMRKIALTSN